MSAAKAKKSEGGSRAVLADRRFAAGVLVFVILVFTPIGGRLSLGRSVDRVENKFFTGVDGRGAVAEYIGDAENAATGLISLGDKYEAAGEATGELRFDKSVLNDVMEGRDISEYSSANAMVVSSFGALRDALMSLQLSEQDAADLEMYSNQFANAQGAIPHSGYNEAAEEFTRGTYNRFPAKLIGSLMGVDPPRTFQ